MNLPWNSVAQASLAPPASVPERYAELWWYSGGNTIISGGIASAGQGFVAKGTTSGTTTYNVSQAKLYTVNANWPATTKFAFEGAIQTVSGDTGYAALWDITSNAIVSASQISTTATTATVVRSGQFTLTPGHVYGVTIWYVGGAANPVITDASLIIFS